jgi:hypothetical protein
MSSDSPADRVIVDLATKSKRMVAACRVSHHFPGWDVGLEEFQERCEFESDDFVMVDGDRLRGPNGAAVHLSNDRLTTSRRVAVFVGRLRDEWRVAETLKYCGPQTLMMVRQVTLTSVPKAKLAWIQVSMVADSCAISVDAATAWIRKTWTRTESREKSTRGSRGRINDLNAEQRYVV